MNPAAMTIQARPFVTLSLVFALPLAVAACGPGGDAAEAPPLAGAAIGGDFALVDKTGKTVRWSDFAGRYRIVYFGYTFCPDACPTDVGITIRGLNQFTREHPALGGQVVPLFITIDPARDTPQAVGQFTAAFSPRLIGLTGSPQAIDRTAKAFAVYYHRGKGTAGGYLMDHSRVVYLMGRNGEPIDMLPADKGPQAVADTLAKWVK